MALYLPHGNNACKIARYLDVMSTFAKERIFNNHILPSYLPMLCQHSTIRPKDSTGIIQPSTILFWNGSFVKARTKISPTVLYGILIQ